MDSAKYGTNIHEKASPKNFVVLVSTCVTIMTLLYILFHELFFMSYSSLLCTSIILYIPHKLFIPQNSINNYHNLHYSNAKNYQS